MSNPIPDVTLSAHKLTRRFGNQQVIHDVSLQLRRGEVLGLLGHNGAGKTTTLQMLTGCLLPDSGEIEICGINLLRKPALAKAHLGYLPETPPLYRELSVNDYLLFAARLRGLKPAAAAEALAQARQRCGLEAVGKKIIGTLSKGFQQRVGIAQAIIHRPAVIVLDEPTIGLDPMQIRDIRNLIRELGDSSSVILSTHLLSEVENVCDRVEIMHHGKLIYSDSSTHMMQYGNGKMKLEEVFIEITGAGDRDELQDNNGSVRAEPFDPAQDRLVEAHTTGPSTGSGRTGEER